METDHFSDIATLLMDNYLREKRVPSRRPLKVCVEGSEKLVHVFVYSEDPGAAEKVVQWLQEGVTEKVADAEETAEEIVLNWGLLGGDHDKAVEEVKEALIAVQSRPPRMLTGSEVSLNDRAFVLAMNPHCWPALLTDAWNKHMPDEQKAFEALKAAAIRYIKSGPSS